MLTTKISFHGHSTFSDGIDNLTSLIKSAQRLNIDYFGVSDHDTTQSIRPFYQLVSELNIQSDFQLIPICASEIRVVEDGVEIDCLFAKVGPLDEEFINWLEETIKARKSIKLVETISQAVNKFDCLVVLPHPEMKFASSTTFEKLVEVAENLDPKVIQNVGVEVNNWTSNVFPNNKKREAQLAEVVKEINLAKFGLADFHCAADIGNQYSLAEVEDKTPQALMEAVKQRRVRPGPMGNLNLLTYLKLYLTVSRAFVRHEILSPFTKP